MKAPRERNLSGFTLIPRHWWRDSRAMSSRQRELYLILANFADWDPRHDRFGLVRFSLPDLADFANLEAWSSSTFKRTISELIESGELKRVKYGEYRIVKMAQFLSKHVQDRAGTPAPSRKPKSPQVSQDGPQVGQGGSQVGHCGPQVGQFSKSSDVEPGPKNVKNLKKESTGDFFLDAEQRVECPYLSASKRPPLLAAVAQTFADADELAKAGSAIVCFHAARVARGLECRRTDCLEALIRLVEAVRANAKSNPVSYLEKGLTGLLEDATDAKAKAKEHALLGRTTSPAPTHTHTAGDVVGSLRINP